MRNFRLILVGFGVTLLTCIDSTNAQDWLFDQHAHGDSFNQSTDGALGPLPEFPDLTLLNHLHDIDQQCDTRPPGQEYHNLMPPKSGRLESKLWDLTQEYLPKFGGKALEGLGTTLGRSCQHLAALCVPALAYLMSEAGEYTVDKGVGWLRESREFQKAQKSMREFVDFEYRWSTFIDPVSHDTYFKIFQEWENYISGTEWYYHDSTDLWHEYRHQQNITQRQRFLDEQHQRFLDEINSNPGGTIDDYKWEKLEQLRKTG